jgi:hypothetical protein
MREFDDVRTASDASRMFPLLLSFNGHGKSDGSGPRYNTTSLN